MKNGNIYDYKTKYYYINNINVNVDAVLKIFALLAEFYKYYDCIALRKDTSERAEI